MIDIERVNHYVRIRKACMEKFTSKLMHNIFDFHH